MYNTVDAVHKFILIYFLAKIKPSYSRWEITFYRSP